MKKYLCLAITVLLIFSGCKPIPQEEMKEIEVIQNTNEIEKNETVKASIPYIQSEIPVDASVTRFTKEPLFSYTPQEIYFPKLSSLYEIFPQFKDAIVNAKTDSEERIIPPLSLIKDEMLLSVTERYARVVIRQLITSDERKDDEYKENEEMNFNKPYEEVETFALNTARKLLDDTDYSFKIEAVRRYGKGTDKNYYVFFILVEYDGVTFSSYGRKTHIGKDEEGYDKYNTLRGGNKITIYIDEQGISRMDWNIQKVEKYHQAELLSFEYLFSKIQTQITQYDMINFAEYELNKDGTYKEGSIKPFTISKIEMIYALDLIYKNDEKNDIYYVPCWKLTSFDSKGAERYIIVNAVDGEILTARF